MKAASGVLTRAITGARDQRRKAVGRHAPDIIPLIVTGGLTETDLPSLSPMSKGTIRRNK